MPAHPGFQEILRYPGFAVLAEQERSYVAVLRDAVREAAGFGYHRVAATPPFYYKHPPSAIRRYYERIAEAAGMPVIIYNFPGSNGFGREMVSGRSRVPNPAASTTAFLTAIASSAAES